MSSFDRFLKGLTWDNVLSLVILILVIFSYIALRIVRKRKRENMPSREERDRIAYENAAEYRAEWERTRNTEDKQQ